MEGRTGPKTDKLKCAKRPKGRGKNRSSYDFKNAQRQTTTNDAEAQLFWDVPNAQTAIEFPLT